MPRSRTRVQTLTALAALAGGLTLALLQQSPDAVAAGSAEVLADCVPGSCPAADTPPHAGPILGRDAAVNIFVGGDLRVRELAAEAEGRVVVLGDLDVAKNTASGPQRYDMGLVGVGSMVVPPDGSDWVTVGADITTAAGNTIGVGGVDPAATPAWGHVPYGGTAAGANIEVFAPGELRVDAGIAARYADLAAAVPRVSSCLAELGTTGSVQVANGVASFNGDGTSPLQVFEVSQDLGAPGSPIDLEFTGVPTDATVVVNLLGGSRQIHTYAGGIRATVNEVGDRLVWNAPTATVFEIHALAQFQGALLAGNQAGTTVVDVSGTNGRIALAGDLVHGAGLTQGAEMHSYPFRGQLPDCEPPVTEPPVTEPPVTEPPVTEPPVTEPPTPPVPSPVVTPPGGGLLPAVGR